MTATPFRPPTYPFDRLRPLATLASKHEGGMVDLSVGTPCDPPPDAVIAALGGSGAERGYPSGVGSARLRAAALGWVERRFGVALEPEQLAFCIGTKEFVAGLPHWLRLRRPERDVVLYPEVAYPTYAMGALLAGARPVAVPVHQGRLALETVSEENAERALCLWVNSPSNPTGALDDLAAAASWGRAREVPVLSDECYAEFTWQGPPATILSQGSESVLALHSISKRSNAAGLRCGFYVGDPELVHYLSELRRHAGFMVPGPIQLAGAVALEDDEHVIAQRERYRARLEKLRAVLVGLGIDAELPAGGFYLWVRLDGSAAPRVAERAMTGAPWHDEPGEAPAWGFTRALAEYAGTLVSPGDFYAEHAADHVRIAVVQPDERLALIGRRLGVAID